MTSSPTYKDKGLADAQLPPVSDCTTSRARSGSGVTMVTTRRKWPCRKSKVVLSIVPLMKNVAVTNTWRLIVRGLAYTMRGTVRLVWGSYPSSDLLRDQDEAHRLLLQQGTAETNLSNGKRENTNSHYLVEPFNLLDHRIRQPAINPQTHQLRLRIICTTNKNEE
ncbi:hypothetical protein SELMODRAFT_431961 [Selaginella moellendorffii]|uniref:Uncharacterized protein n=1 Tax=Selaginella moellendorffii TaxID=88036 RepID=D8TEI1_SELML|nr:hypothetical protein SELMODRAFT_431961 [Selaginella moellendorffii]